MLGLRLATGFVDSTPSPHKRTQRWCYHQPHCAGWQAYQPSPAFFSLVCRVGTNDPVFRMFPSAPEADNGIERHGRREGRVAQPLLVVDCVQETVQMTLDDVLVQEIDQVVKELGTTRSAFAREAFRAAIAHVRRQAMERMHREGYARQPVQPGEFSDWEDEQVLVE